MIYYLGVRFSKETNRILHEYRLQNNLNDKPMPKLGFHTTIIYSREPFTFDIHKFSKPFLGVITGNASLYRNSLVMLYDDSYSCYHYPTGSCLYDMYDIAVQNGASSDHPVYIPHITIAEDCETLPILKNTYIPIILSELFYMEW